MKKIGLLIACLVFCSNLYAVNYPEPTGFVVDQANLLSQKNIQEMSAIATSVSQNGGPEVAVVTIPSISPETVETYTIRLAEKWKVGKNKKDNGVIILVALKERKIRIEVGTGLEGRINDAKAGDIIAHQISPFLKRGEWDNGIRNGFNSVINQVKGA